MRLASKFEGASQVSKRRKFEKKVYKIERRGKKKSLFLEHLLFHFYTYFRPSKFNILLQ